MESGISLHEKVWTGFLLASFRSAWKPSDTLNSPNSIIRSSYSGTSLKTFSIVGLRTVVEKVTGNGPRPRSPRRCAVLQPESPLTSLRYVSVEIILFLNCVVQSRRRRADNRSVQEEVVFEEEEGRIWKSRKARQDDDDS
jgi:hypothetical protein